MQEAKGKKPKKNKDKRAYPIKGTVLAVDADSLTIEAKAHGRHEGGEIDVLVNATTHVTVDEEFAELSAIEVGMKAHAVCRKVGGAYVAKNVHAETSEAEQEPEEPAPAG